MMSHLRSSQRARHLYDNVVFAVVAAALQFFHKLLWINGIGAKISFCVKDTRCVKHFCKHFAKPEKTAFFSILMTDAIFPAFFAQTEGAPDRLGGRKMEAEK